MYVVYRSPLCFITLLRISFCSSFKAFFCPHLFTLAKQMEWGCWTRPGYPLLPELLTVDVGRVWSKQPGYPLGPELLTVGCYRVWPEQLRSCQLSLLGACAPISLQQGLEHLWNPLCRKASPLSSESFPLWTLIFLCSLNSLIDLIFEWPETVHFHGRNIGKCVSIKRKKPSVTT